jgi:molecular chaperone GrpE
MPKQQPKKTDPENQVESPEAEVPTTGLPGAPAAQAPQKQDTAVEEAERLREQLGLLERQLEETRDRAMRAQAELENLRKRAARDVENAHKYALERFVGDLLPVIDSIELGLDAAAAADNVEAVRQGMDLTRKMFLDTLARFEVAPIDPAGEKFDPERHQAVSVQEIAGTAAGTIVTVMQKGYELNGRLVRPAMVVVAK